jgi:hypothetical protein
LVTETDIVGDFTRKAGTGNLNVSAHCDPINIQIPKMLCSPTHYSCCALPGDKKIHKIYKLFEEKVR